MEEVQHEDFSIDRIISTESASKAIEVLMSGRGKEQPDLRKIEAEIDPKQHAVFDNVNRPDKMVETDNGSKVVLVNRVAIALQKRIVNSAVNFLFANPVVLNSDPENESEEFLLTAIKKVYYKNKIESFDRELARSLFSYTEVAEIWFVNDTGESHDKYGFNTRLKVKNILVSPKNGNELFPYFSATGDMIAFSRKYTTKDTSSKNIDYFETYTDKVFAVWKKDGNEWEVVKKLQNPYGKIPVIYAEQDVPEWEDAQILIERLETLLSNFAETNDYHSDPKITVTGEIKSWSQKGEAGAVIEMEQGADAKYMSWDHSTESVKLEIETLLRFIYSLTQTPDVSFDSVKGLSAISGIALKILFSDAHLKVKDKCEIFDKHMQRRISVLTAILTKINPAFKSAADTLEITPEITPFMITSESDAINNLVTASGGKAVISQKTAVQTLGWAKDADEELAQIKDEELAANTMDVFSTAI